jgi:hypothetical protein
LNCSAGTEGRTQLLWKISPNNITKEYHQISPKNITKEYYQRISPIDITKEYLQIISPKNISNETLIAFVEIKNNEYFACVNLILNMSFRNAIWPTLYLCYIGTSAVNASFKHSSIM